MTDIDRLYELLPAVLRTRDADEGQALRALATILGQQASAIEDDVETTWDNWFIETCEEWLVPYIGEALGVHALRDIDAADFSMRAYVANALQRRQRKGTIAATEELARDVTGYPARAVEMFRLTATNINVNHTREHEPASLGTVEVRDPNQVATIASPFESVVRTPDVRALGSNQVRHNLANVVIFLWRVQSQQILGANARPDPGDDRWFRFDPLGADLGLFNLPVGEASIDTLSGTEHVPRPVTRLEMAQAEPVDLPFSVTTVTGTGGAAVTTEMVIDICDLSDAGGALPTRQPAAAGEVMVDPELGRISLHPDDVPPAGTDFEVLVDHAVGFPGRVGAGPTDRSHLLDQQLAGRSPTFQCGVSRTQAAVGAELIATTLDDAVDAWHAHLGALTVAERSEAVGVIVIMDSRTYQAPATTIDLLDGSVLVIVAGRWPEAEIDGFPARRTGDIDANRQRPHVIGDLVARGSTAAGSATGGGFVLNGLLVEGTVRIDPGDLTRVDLAACTVTGPPTSVEIVSADPDPDPAALNQTNGSLEISVARSIIGRIAANRELAGVRVTDSFVSATPHAIDVDGTPLDITSSTTRGAIRCHTLDASDCILDEGDTDPVDALRIAHTQDGCIRFSYAPHGASTPQRYRCQPDLALDGVTDPVESERIISLVRPGYSTELGSPGFGLLRPDVPEALRTAASDGSEPGVWHHLQHARRMANLRTALRHDLRFGLDAGVVLDH